MIFDNFFELLFLLLAAHWICDYPLQGEFLAKAKKDGPLAAYHLFAHAGIHGASVFLITGSMSLGLIEWGLHTLIDSAKCDGKTTFADDQILHILCKVGFALVFVIANGVNWI